MNPVREAVLEAARKFESGEFELFKGYYRNYPDDRKHYCTVGAIIRCLYPWTDYMTDFTDEVRTGIGDENYYLLMEFNDQYANTSQDVAIALGLLFTNIPD